MVVSQHPHVSALQEALALLDVDRLETWGRLLAGRLSRGRKLLVAGNGGSAAEAQHLTSELVGRFSSERIPLPALALHADSSTVTAVSNDYGFDNVFARQVLALGREGDVLILLSTSGRSENLLRAADEAVGMGLITWALTGPVPNPLADRCQDAVYIAASSPTTVQECHLAAVHILCAALDAELTQSQGRDRAASEHRQRDGAARVERRTQLAESDGNPRRHQRLVVIGDVLLDRDVEGEPTRLAPGLPVPVVRSTRTSVRPGGAGLAALMAAREPEWEVTLIGGVGHGDAGEEARHLLMSAGVEVVDVVDTGTTPVKTRIIAAGQTVARVDDIPEFVTFTALPARALEALGEASALLVCDYGLGLTSHEELRAALTEAAARVPVVWDPHVRGGRPVDGTALAVPNAEEAAAFADCSSSSSPPPHDLAADIQRAHRLLREWPVKAIAVTRGSKGAVLVQDPLVNPLVLPSRSVEGDTCGAGDRFAVSTALMLGLGKLPSQAVAAAVDAATAYVATGGPRGVEEAPDPLEHAAGMELVNRIRARGGRVVGTGGCFDILHVGHVSMLEQARSLGDCLVVCLNSDESVARLKGPSRPVVPASERARLLRALSCVDEVMIFDEDTPDQILRALRPDIWVKGGDYGGGRIVESDLVESMGGEVVVVTYLEGRSTTSLLAKAQS